MNFVKYIFLIFAGIISLKEIAGSCPEIPFRQYGEAPERTFPICTILYPDTNCRGRQYGMGIGQSTAKELDMPKSIRINPGCMVKMCNGKTCHSHEAGTKMLSLDKIDLGSNTSFLCTCGEGSDALDDSDPPSKLRRSETPPLAFPDSSVLHTCAVMVEHFSAHGVYTWIHDGASLKSIPADLTNPGVYSYAITRPGCTLNFCTDVAFGGDCLVIRPGRYTSGEYDLFTPNSLSCSCEGNEEGPSTTSPKFSGPSRRTTTVTDDQDEDGLFPMRTSRPTRRTTTTTFDQYEDGLLFATTPRPSRSTRRGVRTTTKSTIQDDE